MTTDLEDHQRWRGLEDWLLHSNSKGAAIAKLAKKDFLHRAVQAWENDRFVLAWALRTTPATTPRAIRVKALAVQTGLSIGEPA